MKFVVLACALVILAVPAWADGGGVPCVIEVGATVPDQPAVTVRDGARDITLEGVVEGVMPKVAVGGSCANVTLKLGGQKS